MKILDPKEFVSSLLSWSKKHGRCDLPWQQFPTPYTVHVSEVMLQQTQVSTVIPYYYRWMDNFVDLQTLASASEDKVMRCWQGLGYYSRAHNLRRAAHYLIEKFSGHYPRTIEQIRQIPGIGRYTAGAIVSFAYDEPGPIVDGNIKRLFCRYFAIQGMPSSSTVLHQLWKYAELYTPKAGCRDYAQSLLDMGAKICTAKRPDCRNCPLAQSCQAKISHQVEVLPTPTPPKKRRVVSGRFSWNMSDDRLWLEKRPSPGIWAGLWCLPEIEISQCHANSRIIGHFHHTFSHYKLDAQVINQHHSFRKGRFFSYEELNDIGLPTPIRKFIQRYW